MVRRALVEPGLSWEQPPRDSRFVRVANLLYLPGQMPVDAAGAVVGVGDIRAQARETFARLAAVLAEAGSSLADVIEATFYLTHLRDDFFQLWRVKDEFFTGKYPAMTVIGVAGLALTGQRIEIRATALARPGRPAADAATTIHAGGGALRATSGTKRYLVQSERARDAGQQRARRKGPLWNAPPNSATSPYACTRR